jgi:peptidyl-prolyl cis-trans isomerase C
MKRHFMAVALMAAAAAPMFAQGASDKVVASINGETVTRAELDQLWSRIGEKMQQQYVKNGRGKVGFLENYVGKRLILQKAMKDGFGGFTAGTKLDPQAESALFDRYVREVVAANIVTEKAIRDFYDENPSDFMHQEQARVHIIHVGTKTRPESDAQAILVGVMEELFKYRTNPEGMLKAFGAAARRFSEHPSAAKAGDIGWITRGTLDPALDELAFSMRLGTVSGIVKEHDELHLMMVDARRPAGKEPFEEARGSIRDFLLSQNTPKVLQALNDTTTKLRASGKVAVYAENLK